MELITAELKKRQYKFNTNVKATYFAAAVPDTIQIVTHSPQKLAICVCHVKDIYTEWGACVVFPYCDTQFGTLTGYQPIAIVYGCNSTCSQYTNACHILNDKNNPRVPIYCVHNFQNAFLSD